MYCGVSATRRIKTIHGSFPPLYPVIQRLVPTIPIRQIMGKLYARLGRLQILCKEKSPNRRRPSSKRFYESSSVEAHPYGAPGRAWDSAAINLRRDHALDRSPRRCQMIALLHGIAICTIAETSNCSDAGALIHNMQCGRLNGRRFRTEVSVFWRIGSSGFVQRRCSLALAFGKNAAYAVVGCELSSELGITGGSAS